MAIDFDFSTASDEEEDIIPLEGVDIPLEPVEDFDFTSAKTLEPAQTDQEIVQQPTFEKEPGGFFATEESEARNQGLGPNAELTESQARGTTNRQKLIDAITKTEDEGYPVPHFIGAENEPEGDRGPTKDMESLAKALKLQQEELEQEGNSTKAAEIARERAYWENEIATKGMSADQWRQQTGEPEPTYDQNFDFSTAKEEEPSDFDFTSAETTAHPVGIVTAYRPGGGASMGLNAGIEGGDVDAHDTPILGRTTVEDYIAGRGDYVTVAMDKDSSWQGQFLSSPDFPGMVFQVRDNGGYGNGKTGENWIDIAYTDPQKAKSMLLRGVPFTPITPEQAQTLSASRPDIDHTPRLQALYVPGGSFSHKEDTGLPDPFMEFSARTARGVETGTREMFGGAVSMVEAGTRGERNVYLDEEEPTEKAEGDIPLLEEQIAALQKQMREQTLKDDPTSSSWIHDTTLDSPELQKLDKQLKQARRAAAGDLRENAIGQLSRQTERLAREAETSQASAMKKYEPYISASRDTQWGFQLADALGTTVPGVLASIGNPVFGAATIYAQIYQASMGQYMTQKPEATREEAQKFANDQALAQTPWAIAGNQLTARALKASFAALPAGAVERGARIFGTQLGQAVAKNAQAFVGNVGSAVGQSMMSDMVSEDYDLLEDTDLGEKFTRSLEPASLAGGVSLVFGVGGMAVATARRPAEAPTKTIEVGGKPPALPAPGAPPSAPAPAAKPPAPSAPKRPPPSKPTTAPASATVLPGDTITYRDPLDAKVKTGTVIKGIPTQGRTIVDLGGKIGRALVYDNWVISSQKSGTALAPVLPASTKALPPPTVTSPQAAQYGPLAPGQTRPKYQPVPPSGALPPSTSIVPSLPVMPKGHVVSIIPMLSNPILRRHINYAPGQRAGFGGLRSPIRQWQRFFIGTASVMERTPGLEGLGQKIRDYVDDKALFYAQENNWARKFEKTLNAKEKGIAQEELHRFFLQSQDPDVNVQKKAIDTYWAASEKGREFIDLTRDYLNRSGLENQAMGFVVFDPTTQKFRPIGKIAGGGDPIPPVWYPGWKPGYFPRMIHPDHMKIIRDPTGSVPAYEALKDQVAAMGFPRDSIDSHLDGLKEKTTNNEFFASVDLARTSKLPNTMFDYSFESVRRYMAARAERKAQINNFGQVKAHSGPESLTLFDTYIKGNENFRMDQYTKNYVARVRDNVLNIQTTQDPAATAVQKLGTLLTGVHLGDPLVASRNLAGGQSTIAGILGIKHYMKGVKDAFTNIDEAYEKGIILHDMANLMEQSEGLGGVQKFTNWMLKWSGEAPAENFNRMVNFGAAKSLLRDALEEYKRNPLSRKSRENFGYFKRMGGIDPQALIDEGGRGPLTDRYLRQSVRYIQGGYQIDQTPLFQNTENAKFFFKYSKFGTQHLDLFNKEVIGPAIRELFFGKFRKEFVEIRDPTTGKMEKVPVPGKLSTAVRYFLAMAAGGAAAVGFARYAFGAEDKTESWTELIRKLNKDKQQAFFDALYKLFQYGMVSGAGGYLGNVAQYGLDWTQKTRVKDPLNPPIIDLAKSSTELIMAAVENGGVPRMDDLDQYLRRNVSSYRTAWKAGAYLGNDVFPLGFHELKRESMLQDVKWLRNVTQRYEKAMGIAAPSPWRPGVGTKTAMTTFHYNVKEALLLGDAPEARRLIKEHFSKMKPKQREAAMDSLMDSVRAGRPIKVGGSTSEAGTMGFLRWADANMSTVDAVKLRRMDQTYRDTSVAARILKPGRGETTREDVRESLRRMQMRKELSEIQ